MLTQYNKVIKSWLSKPVPVLDEDSVIWLFDVFEWSLQQFDTDTFFSKSRLILPNNQFFPGRETSLEGMAQMIFNQVQDYTNLKKWKFQIIPHTIFEPLSTEITTELISDFVNEKINSIHALPVPYDPQMIANPEALIGSYAHSIAQYLVLSSRQEPPGGVQNLTMITEVIAVYMGFGIILANTGFTHRGGCGSCSASLSTRQSALSQFDITYALSIFANLKKIPQSKVMANLKSSLKGYYKKSFKDVEKHQAKLEELRGLMG